MVNVEGAESFDLISEPWLQVVYTSGETAEVGIQKLFEDAHLIQDLVAQSRVERLALLRMLLPIAIRSVKNWDETWERGEFDGESFRAYLEPLRRKFNLFGETPFYQVRNLTECGGLHVGGETSIDRIFMQVSSDNQVLFATARPGTTLSYAEAARALVVRQMYAPGGKQKGVSVIASTFRGEKVSSSASPSPAYGVTGLTLLGTTLFATLMMNIPLDIPSDDAPAWERTDDVQCGNRLPTGPMDIMTWQSRNLELVQENGQVKAFKSLPGFKTAYAQGALINVDPHGLFKIRGTKISQEMFIAPDPKSPGKTKYPRDAVGGLFSMMSKGVDASAESQNVSLVLSRLEALPSNPDRFLAFEIAHVTWGDAFGAIVNFVIEDAVRIPHRFVVDEEARTNLAEALSVVFEKMVWLSRTVSCGYAFSPEVYREVDHIIRRMLSSGAEEREIQLACLRIIRSQALRMFGQIEPKLLLLPVRGSDSSSAVKRTLAEEINIFLGSISRNIKEIEQTMEVTEGKK